MENLNLNTTKDLKTNINDFSLNFLKSYHHFDKNSNLFYSPISLASPLSLLVVGANGSTQQELVDLLGYNDLIKNQSLEAAFKKVKLFFRIRSFNAFFKSIS